MAKEVIYVLKTLDKSTHIKLIIMVIVTAVLSITFFSTLENPVIEQWKENRETEQHFEERKEKRQEKTGQSENKEPVY